MAFRYSDLLVDVMASNGCPNPSKPQCPQPSRPQCPDPSVTTNPTNVFATALRGGLPLLREQLRHSVVESRALS